MRRVHLIFAAWLALWATGIVQADRRYPLCADAESTNIRVQCEVRTLEKRDAIVLWGGIVTIALASLALRRAPSIAPAFASVDAESSLWWRPQLEAPGSKPLRGRPGAASYWKRSPGSRKALACIAALFVLLAGFALYAIGVSRPVPAAAAKSVQASYEDAADRLDALSGAQGSEDPFADLIPANEEADAGAGPDDGAETPAAD